MDSHNQNRRVGQASRRTRLTAVVTLVAVAAIAPGPALAALPAMSFGTVSVGSVKTLTRTVPLTAALSDLPAGTVLYAGGNDATDLLLALAGLSVPLTSTALIATVGDISASYHLAGSLSNGTDYEVSAPDCPTGTVSCSADVTFTPTTTGARTDTLNWVVSDVQITGGGGYESLLQALAGLIGQSFADQLAIPLDGIGVPTTGGINAQVDIAASVACIELSTTSIDFGSSTLGAEAVPASPTITVTNCSGVSETLFARGTDAAGPSSAWALVDSPATCATDLGLDNYRLGLELEDLSVLGLSTLNKTVQPLAAGEDADQVARIWTACPGSTGAGVVMTMQLHYLVVGD